MNKANFFSYILFLKNCKLLMKQKARLLNFLLSNKTQNGNISKN